MPPRIRADPRPEPAASLVQRPPPGQFSGYRSAGPRAPPPPIRSSPRNDCHDRGGLMYRDRDGNEYFVVDSHLHWWDASPENQKNKYGAGFISCFYDYHSGLSPEEYVWPREKYEKYDQETMVQRPVRRRLRRRRDLPADLPDGLLRQRLQHHRARRGAEGEVSRPVHPQQRLGPARRGGRPRRLRGEGGEVRHQGRQALHGRVAGRLARLAPDRPVGGAVSREVRRAGREEHARPQGPDDLAARQGLVRRLRRRPRGDELHRPQLHRRARRHAAGGRLLLDRRPGAQRLRRPRGADALHPPPAEVLRRRDGGAAVLARRGPPAVRLRLRPLAPEVARREVRRLRPARAGLVRDRRLADASRPSRRSSA